MTSPRTLITLCLYHRKDKTGKVEQSLLANSHPMEDSEKYICDGSKNLGNNWEYITSFYAFSPMLRPIPSGLQLIQAAISTEYPYSTTSVEIVSDIFNDDPNAVMFLSWTYPVPYTIPLFIYKISESSVLITLTPQEKHATSELFISPIFCIGGEKIKKAFKWDNKTDRPIIKFKYNLGRCIPDPKGESLINCFLLYDKNINNKNYPRNLIDILSGPINNRSKISPYISDSLVMIIVDIVLVGVMVIIIISIYKKMKNKYIQNYF